MEHLAWHTKIGKDTVQTGLNNGERLWQKILVTNQY